MHRRDSLFFFPYFNNNHSGIFHMPVAVSVSVASGAVSLNFSRDYSCSGIRRLSGLETFFLVGNLADYINNTVTVECCMPYFLVYFPMFQSNFFLTLSPTTTA